MRQLIPGWLAGLAAAAAALFAFACWTPTARMEAAEIAPKSDSGIQVRLNAETAAPRQLEDTTQSAIVRDYGTAWKALETALAENRSDALDAGLVGFARERAAQRVAEQKKSGLRTRYVDHGHRLEAVFYSPEGSSMQLRDTAQLEIQVLDGGTVLSTRNITRHYLALMTVAEDRWKLRALQELP